jgi:hypothetical protein
MAAGHDDDDDDDETWKTKIIFNDFLRIRRNPE